MPVRRPDVPRSVLLLAAALVAVPTLLWLFTVWDTRPPSAEDVAADRARVAATAAYAEDLEWCRWNWPTTDCERISLTINGVPDPAREALDLSPDPWDVATVAVLAMAATSMLIGALWPPGPGVRPLLRRAALVATATWLVAAEVGVLWWSGLELSARMRGLDPSVGEATWSFVRYAALLVGLAGIAGTAAGVLLRGRVRAVLTASGAAVTVGMALLLATPPMDPWLPRLNVEAFLFGDAVYQGHAGATRDITRTTGPAAAYLAGWVALLLLAASAVTAVAGATHPRRDSADV